MGAADRNPSPAAPSRPQPAALGIDVGGTKIAAGVVDPATGAVLERRRLPTRPERGGAAVLDDCAALAAALAGGRLPVGIGLCELVDLDGRPSSADTIDWRGLDPVAAIDAPRVVVESDVRAAALAEARFGAGAGVSPFLHVVVGTGASACLVVDGHPYAGGRGEALVLGAPPVELQASGPALARAAGLERGEDVLGDPAHIPLVDAAAEALGGVLAVLANALDPSLIVLGGGLGVEPAFRERVERACRPLLAYPRTPPLPLVGSLLGPDGGVVGAALVALSGRE
ncbi:MAG TPA: ROK family protein [Gaiellaceae bacterium]|nr:ROK family protein [Gaiellaceae bacterium]